MTIVFNKMVEINYFTETTIAGTFLTAYGSDSFVVSSFIKLYFILHVNNILITNPLILLVITDYYIELPEQIEILVQVPDSDCLHCGVRRHLPILGSRKDCSHHLSHR